MGTIPNSKPQSHLRRIEMRKLSLLVALLLAATTASFARAKARTGTFIGEIMDSPCAKMGSHDAGYKMTGTNTPKDCTLACVKAGGKFVLYNPAKKATCELDNQEEPRQFAGEKVKVTGTYNPATKTIHVEKIEAAK
jgi:Protein of unknown function (DUF5818)